MKFTHLVNGQSFDWISPHRLMNSFFLRCVKISARRYRDETGAVHRVGSVYVDVYNVRPA